MGKASDSFVSIQPHERKYAATMPAVLPDGEDKTLAKRATTSAPPPSNQHQMGLTVDINPVRQPDYCGTNTHNKGALGISMGVWVSWVSCLTILVTLLRKAGRSRLSG